MRGGFGLSAFEEKHGIGRRSELHVFFGGLRNGGFLPYVYIEEYFRDGGAGIDLSSLDESHGGGLG